MSSRFLRSTACAVGILLVLLAVGCKGMRKFAPETDNSRNNNIDIQETENNTKAESDAEKPTGTIVIVPDEGEFSPFG